MENKLAVKDIIVKRILADLENGVLTWKKMWSMANAPRNYVSGHEYSGINRLILATSDYQDYRYITANQANKLGGKIRKGEHGIQIVFWMPIEISETNEAGVDEAKTIPFLKYYTVFNITQTEGIDYPQLVKTERLKSDMQYVVADSIIDNYPAPAPEIVHKNSDRATYYPELDKIVMPMFDQFTTPEDYYDTLFHELGHSTGIARRLNRRQLDSQTGTDLYGREELIAEITSSFLCAHCDITGIEMNQSAYIQGWLKVIKEKPDLIISAAGHAEKAYKYIIGKGETNESI